MKNTVIPFLLVIFLAAGLAGCGDNSGTGSILGPNNNSVSFTMGVQASPNGAQFTWVPSKSVKVTSLILGTTGFTDTITDNTGQLYTGGQTWAYANEYTGVTTGQQWQFAFTGTDSAGTAYNSTANLTIP